MMKDNKFSSGSGEGIDNWEKEEEMIMKEIRMQSDELEIPESLLPENMMKKIKAEEKKGNIKKQKNHRMSGRKTPGFYMKSIAAITAAAVCIVTVGHFASLKGSFSFSTEPANGKETEYGKQPQLMVQAESREEILSKLNQTNNDNIYKGDIYENSMDFAYGVEVNGESEEMSKADDTSTDSQDNYYKDTNEQVEGVSEGDTVKTDGKYIYIIQSESPVVKIVEANNGQVKDISKISYKEELEKDFRKDFQLENDNNYEVDISSKEMYVNGDRLTMVLDVSMFNMYINNDMYNEKNIVSDIAYGESYYYSSCYSLTYILSYDISDRSNPKLIAKHTQQGSLETSRVSDGYLYVLSEVNCNSYRKLDSKYCVPYIDCEEVPIDSVYINENGGRSYTVITAWEIEHPEEMRSNVNVLSGSGLIYVSQGNIYITEDKSNHTTREENNKTTEVTSEDTIIYKYSYKNGELTYVSSAQIKGRIDKKFFMDEYNGILRVVGKIDTWSYSMEYLEEDFVKPVIEENRDASEDTIYYQMEKKVMLFYGINACVDKDEKGWFVTNSSVDGESVVYTLNEQLNVLGTIEGIAEGENLYSARFMGNTGYFVTFEQVDPLFAVDFSDPENPSIISELKVPGFSTYLHFWEDDKLLGIGYETESTEFGVRTVGYKLSMFDVSNPQNVTEENKVEKRGSYSEADWDYKDILISKEKNVIGMKTWSDYNNNLGYVVYSYNQENGFVEQFFYEVENEYYMEIKGIIINDVLYLILGDEGINTYDISKDYIEISKLTY